jgi:hypothetical protein
MVDHYALEEQMRQRMDSLRCELEQVSWAVNARRRSAEQAAAQIERPVAAQKGARIWRFRSLPAWSRGSSETKSTERGRL